MAVFGNPEDEVSIGLHERTGDCDEKTNVYTAIGGVSLHYAFSFLKLSHQTCNNENERSLQS